MKNWIEAVNGKELKVKNTVFHMRLGRKRSGAICESFAKATTPQAADDAVTKARGEFFTKNKKIRTGIPDELRGIIEVVFASAHSELLQSIIARFELSFGTGYAYEELQFFIRAIEHRTDLQPSGFTQLVA